MTSAQNGRVHAPGLARRYAGQQTRTHPVETVFPPQKDRKTEDRTPVCRTRLVTAASARVSCREAPCPGSARSVRFRGNTRRNDRGARNCPRGCALPSPTGHKESWPGARVFSARNSCFDRMEGARSGLYPSKRGCRPGRSLQDWCSGRRRSNRGRRICKRHFGTGRGRSPRSRRQSHHIRSSALTPARF